MTGENKLRGVIAAVPTPFTSDLQPDTARFVTLAKYLLDNGCDALNICGTTGEATSMSVVQRKALMSAAAAALPLERLMVGTGAASVADSVELTLFAGQLGFAGALMLPPFYYKSVLDEGVVSYFELIARLTALYPCSIYLYNFPALTGVPFHPALVAQLRSRLGDRLLGIKDSSGDEAYARHIAAQSKAFDVFPSSESGLIDARDGIFAGCISATANITSHLCSAAYHQGDRAALELAKAVRERVAAGPLIPGVKAALASRMKDPAYLALMPPLMALSDTEATNLIDDIETIVK